MLIICIFIREGIILRLFFFIICFFFSCAAGVAYFLLSNPWIDVSILEEYDPGKPTILLDDTGKEWARFQLDRREPISFLHIPDHVVEAFLSAEDWYFYSHYGISWKGIMRSLLVNVWHRKKVQGASTITQQLVKLLFFDLKKTFSRKLKEQLYAVVIEQQYTKEQILELYLNQVYFGCGIYGVQAAAERFWGIPASDLSLDQAATLAGVIKNPLAYCPLLNPDLSEQRRNTVLHSMKKRAVISEEAYEDAVAVPLTIKERKDDSSAPHLKEQIRLFLEELVGKKVLYTGGLTVQTTLNKQMQRIAEAEFKKQIVHLRKELKKQVDGGSISFEVQTGKIKALVGGFDFKHSAFNRVFQAKRQLGSVFKPVVYAAAMEQGMRFSDVEIDEPVQIVQGNSTWSPRNFNHEFNGAITRAYALSRSNNIVTIKTLLDAGIAKVVEMAKRCHLPGPFNAYPSLALGCIDATLQEAASMINIFANNGVYVAPYSINWVKDCSGKKIYKNASSKERVMSAPVASQVAKVLMLGLKRVYKWFSHQWFEGEALSKTGTTNESRTCWYIGSTPTITTAVYIGCDDNQPLGKNVYPVSTAFPIWLGFNRVITSPVKQFIFDPSLRSVYINECSGAISSPEQEGTIEILV